MNSDKLPTIEDLEPAAREYLRLRGCPPHMQDALVYDVKRPLGRSWKQYPSWAIAARDMQSHIAMQMALRMFRDGEAP